MKTMLFLDSTGDTVLTWENDTDEEVIAIEKFNEHIKNGNTFVEVDRDEQGQLVIDQAHKIIDFKDIRDNTEVYALPRYAGG